jgi:ABC-2 type transport system permease protein
LQKEGSTVIFSTHDMNIDEKSVKDLFNWINLEGLGLISVDKKTGGMQDARQIGVAETIIIPYIIVFLMFIMLMMSVVPLLTAVMEEKMNRIAEVLLGSVTPFQFMMGKIPGSIAVSLTASAVYVIGGIITAKQIGVGNMIPYDILPLFIMMPVIQEPLSSFSTTLSLFPPFIPLIMLLRMATPVSIPVWQPIAGLIGVIAFTVFSVWADGRIFRTCILMQGQKPKLGNLIKYIVRG